ncbi:hypothetical protein K1T71_002076 [Dendrolimus kikuchii]|uniref:Uncharacterized protein n=1 Tax=Dendrolimus kikuchii TaxID=765133 RepID=A0ACC1DH07_9NEOP|nr:hypothetical protein K1T71_002076 [Dendrolimus kikuchii]
MIKFLIALLVVSVALVDGVRIFPLPETLGTSGVTEVKPSVQPTYKTSPSKFTAVGNTLKNTSAAFTHVYQPTSGEVPSPSRDLLPPK